MALVATTAFINLTQGTAWEPTRIEIGTGNRAVPADVSNGWNVTALMTRFSPVREKTNPPMDNVGQSLAVDWQDGVTGDSVAYTFNEAGLFVTPAGGAEFMAFYESEATGAIGTKTAGGIYLHRFRVIKNGAAITSGTFNVSLTVPAIEFATEAEAQERTEASQALDKALSVRRGWQQVVAWWGALATIPQNKLPLLDVSKIPDLAISKITGLTAVLAAKADIVSPVLTGNPRAPTPAAGDNDTSIATTAFVNTYTDAVVIHTTQTSYDNASDSDNQIHMLAV